MTNGKPLLLGTRRSELAQWQAQWVAARLGELDIATSIVFISTSGDVRKGPIAKLGGIGVFTKSLQDALVRGQIDLAVHSLKDLPTEPMEGLTLAAVPRRASARDALVSRHGVLLEDLPAGAAIGTGSLRRRAQLLHLRPDLAVKDIRGNVDTRLRKLDEGQYQAILLAEAGLQRLGLADRVTQVLTPSTMLPAVGQGALGIEIRESDRSVADRVCRLDDATSHAHVLAERAMLAHLRGGCLAPIGAWTRETQPGTLALDGVVLSPCGTQRLAASATGPVDGAERMGRQVAEQLFQQGAADLIEASR